MFHAFQPPSKDWLKWQSSPGVYYAMHRFKAYPHLKSVKVIVEERRIDLEMNPGNWRTHEYKGFAALPDRLLPAFASPGTQADIDLVDLVHQACASGNIESRFELPYRDGAGGDKKTVLRTVVVHVYHNKSACARVARKARACSIAMPTVASGVWSVFELRQAERALASQYAKLSPTAIALVVQLAKLDVPPSSGRAKLIQHSQWLLERGHRVRLN